MGNVIKGNFNKQQNREPLPKTHSPNRNPEANDFGDRLTRIRASLQRINKLMVELKAMQGEKCQTKN